jgi:hypothetical protein
MRRCGPRYVHDEGVRVETFEAQSHGFSTCCLRFAGRVAPPPRKTRFRSLQRRFWNYVMLFLLLLQASWRKDIHPSSTFNAIVRIAARRRDPKSFGPLPSPPRDGGGSRKGCEGRRCGSGKREAPAGKPRASRDDPCSALSASENLLLLILSISPRRVAAATCHPVSSIRLSPLPLFIPHGRWKPPFFWAHLEGKLLQGLNRNGAEKPGALPRAWMFVPLRGAGRAKL